MAAMVMGVAAFGAPVPAAAQDLEPAGDSEPAFIAVGAGAYDWNRRKDQGAEFRLEYRSDYKLWHLKPLVAVAGTSTGSAFVTAGVLLDIYLGRRFVVTPSFAPSLYVKGGADLDLDYPLEFRSQIEFAYRFDDRSRLGLAISHYSNASLGDTNPGTESAMLYYAMPVDKVAGWFD